jgi:uncharacterized repeat protein (TIGR03803 family)
MRIRVTRYALSNCVTAAMLAGCGGSQPPIGVPGAMFQVPTVKQNASTAPAAAIVHRIAPELTYHVLHRFDKFEKDGAFPEASLVDLHGVLYGTASIGGPGCEGYGCGTIFSVSTDGTLKVLYGFSGRPDGDSPTAGLIDVKDELYGTTLAGGTYLCGSGGCGTVFSVTTTGAEKVLYSFGGGPDGATPTGNLINVNGTMYGTTTGGGANGYGTVFSVTTTGTEKVLYSFGGSPDGATPEAGLIYVDGALYGTTEGGGGSACDQGCGTIFSVTITGKEKVLHSFNSSPDGARPRCNLVDVHGALYGTTYEGGSAGFGTVFKVSTQGGEKVLYSFAGGSGGYGPYAGLVNLKQRLYGTTGYGGLRKCRGRLGCGTIFSITDTGTERVLYSFSGGTSGAHPLASLIAVKGALYGTTERGGSGCGPHYGPGCGTIFAFAP